mgnify:FL=1
MQRIFITIILLVITLSSIFAGTSGKITGVVTDENGAPLIGVNVLIENTNMGASTNIDGYYAILNVPPGTYALSTSYIGYANVKVTDIMVSIDLTRYVDITMTTEVLMSGEEVIVLTSLPM